MFGASTARQARRVSIGVQDFEPAVQEAANRLQSVDETAAVMIGARIGGARSINLDLMYGLPRQTPESFARTLEQGIAIAAGPHRRIRLRASARTLRHAAPDRQTRTARCRDTAYPAAADRAKAGRGGLHAHRHRHFALPHDDLALAHAAGALQRSFQCYSMHAACDISFMAANGIVRFCSATYEAWLGKNRNHIIDRPLREALGGEDCAA